MGGWTIAAIVVGALLLLVVVGFNRLRRLDVQALEAESGIDVALQRRRDLVPNLVEAVKGYAAHERAVLEAVTAARAAGEAARTLADKAAGDALMSEALLRLTAVAEAYPDLEASENFLALQDELTSTEDRIAFSRQNYNAHVQKLNTATSTIPLMLLSRVAGVGKREFYEVPDLAAHQAPDLRF